MIQRDFKCSYDLTLESGIILRNLNIRYSASSDCVSNRKVIWICHALTANCKPDEWWSNFVGSGKFIDTDKYFVICANIIGSCYGTTGPASLDSNGKQYLLNFPLITVRDVVNAHEQLRKYLQISDIDLLIGGSNGGFQALEWAIEHPSTIKNLCLIATNAVVSPWCTAFNQSQRLSLEADATFREAKDSNGGKAGLAAARSIALLSYRSYAGYSHTQNEEPENPNFILATKSASYQNYQGKKLVDRFNAYSYYTLTLNIDTHNVGRDRGGVNKALKLVKAHTLCIAIESDMLFPVKEMQRIAENVPDCELEVITSLYGHDGFLLEDKKIIEIIKKHIELCKC